MNNSLYGACEFCGQVNMEYETNEEATAHCDCSDALHRRDIENKIEKGTALVEELFNDFDDEGPAMNILKTAISAIAHGHINSVGLTIGNTKCGIAGSPYTKIKVTRTETKKQSREE